MRHCLWCDSDMRETVSWRHVFGQSEQRVICHWCQAQLAPLASPLCCICGRSLQDIAAPYVHDDLCHDCLLWERSDYHDLLRMNRSLFHYNAFLKGMMTQFKFRGDAVIIEGFRQAWQSLYEDIFAGCVIVPVPLSEGRLYERGFNQSMLLAEMLSVSEACWAPVLRRDEHEDHQSRKNRAQRLMFRGGLFSLAGDQTAIRGQSCLIIDDIYTTGTTVRQAARILHNHGAADVSSLTVARS